MDKIKLTQMEAAAISAFDEDQESTPHEIAAEILITLRDLEELITALQKKGLVEKSVSSMKPRAIQLTKMGEWVRRLLTEREDSPRSPEIDVVAEKAEQVRPDLGSPSVDQALDAEFKRFRE